MARAGGRIGDGAALADRACSTRAETVRRSGRRSTRALPSTRCSLPAKPARRFGIELEGEVVLELHGGIVRADRALAAFSRAGSRRGRASACSRWRPASDGVRSYDLGRHRWRPRSRSWPPAPGRRPCSPAPASSSRRTCRRRPWRTSTSRARTPCRRSSTGTRTRAGTHTRWPRRERPQGRPPPLGRVRRARRPTGDPDTAVAEASVRLGAATLSRRRPTPHPSGDVPLHELSTTTASSPSGTGAIVVCSACSGHGFKFAPAVGARVAALA